MTPDRLLELFACRTDDFAIQMGDGRYLRAERPLTSLDVVAHLEGTQTIGVYPIRPEDNAVRWTCIDVDVNDRDLLEMAWQAAMIMGIREDAMLREFSGRKGFHLWCFYADWTPAIEARRLGRYIVEAAKLSGKTEVFPKQDRLEWETDPETGEKRLGFGNLVKLPLGIHRVSGERAMPLDVSGPIEPLTRDELADVLAPIPTPAPLLNGNRPQLHVLNGTGHRALYPCTELMMEHQWPEGERNEGVFDIVRRFDRAGYTAAEITPILLAWSKTQIKPLSDGDIRRLSQQGRYKGLRCERNAAFCKPTCPVWQREHPTEAGIKLQRVMTMPATFNVPMAMGMLKGVTAAQLPQWAAIQDLCTDQFGIRPPQQREGEWIEQVTRMLEQREDVPAPAEVSLPGRVLEWLRQWTARATEEPEMVRRHSVWIDTERGCHVFRGRDFLAFVQNMEKTADQRAVWAALQAVRAREVERQVPGDPSVSIVWEVPLDEDE